MDLERNRRAYITARLPSDTLNLTRGGGGDATRPLPKDEGVEELHGDPTVGPCLKVFDT